ncbi:unnamed protein product [Sphagnum balticum]
MYCSGELYPMGAAPLLHVPSSSEPNRSNPFDSLAPGFKRGPFGSLVSEFQEQYFEEECTGNPEIFDICKSFIKMLDSGQSVTPSLRT